MKYWCYLLFALITTAVLMSCAEPSQVDSRDYVIRISNPSSLEIDSVVVTQVDYDTSVTVYDTATIDFVPTDAGGELLEITLALPIGNEMSYTVSYICYSHGIPIINYSSTFMLDKGAPSYTGGSDSIAIAILKEFEASLNDTSRIDSLINDSLILDSIFAEYMLRKDGGDPTLIFDLYKSLPNADTAAFILLVAKNVEESGSMDSMAVLMENLPPAIIQAVLNKPDRFIFNGVFTQHGDDVAKVTLTVSGDTFNEPVTIDALYDPEIFEFTGFIDIEQAQTNYAVVVAVYDSLNILIGYGYKPFQASIKKIDVESFNAWNAKPHVAIAPIAEASIKDGIAVTGVIVDSLNGGTITKIEWAHGGTSYVEQLTPVFSITLPDTGNAVYPVYCRVTDNDGNVSVDSVNVVVYVDAPVIDLTVVSPLIDVVDSIYFTWTGTEQFGSGISYEFRAERDVNWISVTTGMQVAVQGPDQPGSYKYYLKAIDDDMNVVLDSGYVTAITDKPIPLASTTTPRLSLNDSIILIGSATDSLGAIVLWEWKCDDDSIFVAAPDTTLKLVAPTYPMNKYPCVLRVTDNDGNQATATIAIEVVADVPTFSLGNDTTVTKNSILDISGTASQEFGTIAQYRWDGNGDGAFDDSSAVIALGYRYSNIGVFNAIVEAKDDDDNVVKDTIIVTVVNAAPEGNDTTIVIPEDFLTDSIVGQVTAVDANGDVVIYSIDSGNEDGIFTLSPAGLLTVAKDTLDFERDSVYVLEIQVTDGFGLSTIQVTVLLENLNDNAPVVSNSYSLGVLENASADSIIGSISVVDKDNDVLSYSFISGDTANCSIHDTTGEVTVHKSFNREVDGKTFVYELVITDGVHTDTASFTLRIDNVVEAPVARDTVFTMLEDIGRNISVGRLEFENEEALGLGSGYRRLYYTIVENPNNWFELNTTQSYDNRVTIETRNQSTFKADYETTPICTLTVQIRNYWSKYDTVAVTVNLTDVYEDPIILSDIFSVKENQVIGTTVGTISAELNSGATASYTVVSGYDESFFNLASNGDITTAALFDREDKGDYELKVSLFDGTGTVETVLRIDIEDEVESGTFVDPRDGESYNWVEIDSLFWMTRNLNYSGDTLGGLKQTLYGHCYSDAATHDDNINCETYGRLYTWDSLMGVESSSNLIPSNVRAFCPAGWHLPSLNEWNMLEDWVDTDNSHSNIAVNLKNGAWSTPGTNDFGFTAKPSGYYQVGSSPPFKGVHSQAGWWTATERSSTYTYYKAINGSSYVNNDSNPKGYMYSVRCVMDPVWAD